MRQVGSVSGSHVRVSGGRPASGRLAGLCGLALAALCAPALARPSAAATPVASWSFDEGAGPTAADGTGRGHTGTLRNGAAWSADGHSGGALCLDGVNDRVDVATSPDLALGAAFTLSAWVRPASLGGWGALVLRERTGGFTYALYASDGAGRPPAGYVHTGGDVPATAARPLPLGAWTHLATTWDGARLRLYVNGALAVDRPATGSLPATTRPLRLGASTLSTGEAFHGCLDDVRVYDVALDVAELAAGVPACGVDAHCDDGDPCTDDSCDDVAAACAHTPRADGASCGRGLWCQAGACVAGAPIAPVAAWGFEEGVGGTAYDRAGRGHDGVLRGGATWRADGRLGGALCFDGRTGRVDVPASANLDLGGALTLEAWVWPRTLAGWTTAVLRERSAGLLYALYASDGAGRPPAGYVHDGANRSAVGAQALPLATWSHLATTWDGAVLRLYVNGALVRERAVAGVPPSSTRPLRIGGNALYGEYLDGCVDEVRVYDVALDAARIAADALTPVDPEGPRCRFAADCDDGDPCTDDACAGPTLGCTHAVAADGAPCGEHAVCRGGACAPDRVCGDGRVDAPEACDDGDTRPCDGCDAACAVEPAAAFTWSMADGFGPDRDGDGLVDYVPLADGAAATGPWRVDLACGVPVAGPLDFRWTVDGAEVVPRDPPPGSPCSGWLALGEERPYDVALSWRDAAGAWHVSTQVVTPRDLLVVAFGDSYASGEGAPEVGVPEALSRAALDAWVAAEEAAARVDSLESLRVVAALNLELASADGLAAAIVAALRALLDAAVADVDAARAVAGAAAELYAATAAAVSAGARWQPEPPDEPGFYRSRQRCHRSALGSQAQAALRLEQADPHSRVTFVQVACSGAITPGLLSPGGQLDLARRVLGPLRPDAVLLSIGGNDVDFAPMILACMVNERCDLGASPAPYVDAAIASICASAGPSTQDCVGALRAFSGVSAADLFADGLVRLEGYIPALRDAFADFARGAPVFHTSAPVATQDGAGAVCTGGFGPGVDAPELAWFHAEVGPAVNAALGAVSAGAGFHFVDALQGAFDRHGACAPESYVVGFFEALREEGDPVGFAHPNARGAALMGQLLFDAAAPAVLGALPPAAPGGTCDCPPGFEGPACESPAIDACAAGPCESGGQCADGPGDTFRCVCAPGFAGARCELDVDDCAAAPCVHGRCEDGVDAFRCVCDAGFDGERCERVFDPCDPEPCAHGGRCRGDGAQATCLCPAGTEGARCETVTDAGALKCDDGSPCTEERYVPLGATGLCARTTLPSCVRDALRFDGFARAGDAVVPVGDAALEGGVVSLVPPVAGAAGAAWVLTALPLGAGFTAAFAFEASAGAGPGGVGDDDAVGGGGLAFYVQPTGPLRRGGASALDGADPWLGVRLGGDARGEVRVASALGGVLATAQAGRGLVDGVTHEVVVRYAAGALDVQVDGAPLVVGLAVDFGVYEGSPSIDRAFVGFAADNASSASGGGAGGGAAPARVRVTRLSLALDCAQSAACEVPQTGAPGRCVHRPNATASCASLQWEEAGTAQACASAAPAGVCPEPATLSQAQQVCAAVGARLCAVDELERGVAAQVGCEVPTARVWTADPCASGGVVARGAPGTGSGFAPECTPPGERAAVVCCASVGGVAVPSGAPPSCVTPEARDCGADDDCAVTSCAHGCELPVTLDAPTTLAASDVDAVLRCTAELGHHAVGIAAYDVQWLVGGAPVRSVRAPGWGGVATTMGALDAAASAPPAGGTPVGCRARLPGQPWSAPAVRVLAPSAPLVSGLSLDPVYLGQRFECRFEATSPEGRPLRVEVGWQRTLPGGAVRTVDHAGPDLLSLAVGRADAVRCVVTADDGVARTTVVSPPARVLDLPPATVNFALTSNHGDTYRLSTLSCGVAAFSDPEGDAVSAVATWRVNGAEVASGPVAPGAPSTFAGAFEAGDVVECALDLVDALGATAARSASVEVRAHVPVCAAARLQKNEFTPPDVMRCTCTQPVDRDGDVVGTTCAWYEIDGSPLPWTGCEQSTAGFPIGFRVYCDLALVDGSGPGVPARSQLGQDSRNAGRPTWTTPNVRLTADGPLRTEALDTEFTCDWDRTAVGPGGWAVVYDVQFRYEGAAITKQIHAPGGAAKLRLRDFGVGNRRPGDVIRCRVSALSNAQGTAADSDGLALLDTPTRLVSLTLTPTDVIHAGTALPKCTLTVADPDSTPLIRVVLERLDALDGPPTVLNAFQKSALTVSVDAALHNATALAWARCQGYVDLGAGLELVATTDPVPGIPPTGVIRSMTATPSNATSCDPIVCRVVLDHPLLAERPVPVQLIRGAWLLWSGFPLLPGPTVYETRVLTERDTVIEFAPVLPSFEGIETEDGTFDVDCRVSVPGFTDPATGSESVKAPIHITDAGPRAGSVSVHTPLRQGERARCLYADVRSECVSMPVARYTWWVDGVFFTQTDVPELDTAALPGGTRLSCGVALRPPGGQTGPRVVSDEIVVLGATTLVTGAAAGARLGAAVAIAPDLDGDGVAEVLATAPGVGGGRGRLYVLGGSPNATEPLAAVTRLTVDGAAAGDAFGSALGLLGDVDRDGVPDVGVGAPEVGSTQGAAYVLGGAALRAALASGGVSASLASLARATLAGVAPGDAAGSGISGADLFFDGLADVVVTARGVDGRDDGNGRAYALDARVTHLDVPGGPPLAELPADRLGLRGFVLDGPVSFNDQAPAHLERVVALGDFDGDGGDEVLLQATNLQNTLYLASGQLAGTRAFVDAPFAEGLVRVDGGVPWEFRFDDGDDLIDAARLGRLIFFGAAGAAGDVDGDGLADLVVPSYEREAGLAQVEVAVVFGRAGGLDVSLDAVDAGIGGFVVEGRPGEGSADSPLGAAGVGDVDGDGLDDLAFWLQPSGSSGAPAGRVYVVYGKRDTATVTLAQLEAGVGGYTLDLPAYPSSVAAGDVDGDGLSDFVVGLAGVIPTHTGAPTPDGGVMVVFGTDRAEHLTGRGVGDVSEVYEGTAGEDRIAAGGGDDTVRGRGGEDVLLGGNGDDRLVVGPGAPRRVDGGRGFDTLELAGDADVDLRAWRGRLRGIEALDLGAGPRHVTLGFADAARLSDTTHTLFVRGGAAAALTLVDGPWLDAPALTRDGVRYRALWAGEVRLYVEDAIALSVGPTFVEQVFELREDAPAGTVLGRVSVTDPDGEVVSVTLDDLDPPFALEPAGRTLRLAAATGLDFEQRASWTVHLRATDDTGLVSRGAMYVRVVDVNEPPAFDAPLVTAHVLENSAAGTAVLTLRAADPDSGDVLTYGLEDGNADGAFALDAASGALTVARGERLDFEEVTERVLRVSVTDRAGLRDAQEVRLAVDDSPVIERRGVYGVEGGSTSVWAPGTPGGWQAVDETRSFDWSVETARGELDRTFNGITVQFYGRQSGHVDTTAFARGDGGSVRVHLPMSVSVVLPDEVAPGEAFTVRSTWALLDGASFEAVGSGFVGGYAYGWTGVREEGGVFDGDTRVPLFVTPPLQQRPPVQRVWTAPSRLGGSELFRARFSGGAPIAADHRLELLTGLPGSLQTVDRPNLILGAPLLVTPIERADDLPTVLAGAAPASYAETSGLSDSEMFGLRLRAGWHLFEGEAEGRLTFGQVYFVEVEGVDGELLFEDGTVRTFTVGADTTLRIPAAADVDGDGRVDVRQTLRVRARLFHRIEADTVTTVRSRFGYFDVDVAAVFDPGVPGLPPYEEPLGTMQVGPAAQFTSTVTAAPVFADDFLIEGLTPIVMHAALDLDRGPRPERCDNDYDDDLDGARDCADPECDGAACGAESVCAGGACVAACAGGCDDGVPCTRDVCDVATRRCKHLPDDARCEDDDFFCDGLPRCDATAGCVLRGSPCAAGTICEELTHLCVAAVETDTLRVAALGDGLTAAFAAPCHDGSLAGGLDCLLDGESALLPIGGDFPAYSWATGTRASVDSLARRLADEAGLTAQPTANLAVTGATWEDLPAQARAACRLFLRPGTVTILAGVGDVCGADGASHLPDSEAAVRALAETLQMLTACVGSRTVVRWFGVPRVDRLYDVGLEKQAAPCPGDEHVDCARNWDVLDVCPAVTQQPSPAARAALGAAIDHLNEALADEVVRWDVGAGGRNPNGVRVLTDGSGTDGGGPEGRAFGALRFGACELSPLDCFSPSVVGQARLACEAWRTDPRNGAPGLDACEPARLCGDGVLQAAEGEQCEADADCGADMRCTARCLCVAR